MTAWPAALDEAVRAHPHLLLFATLSGAHLYGFPSPDSDWDLRGAHVLPARTVLGLGGAQHGGEDTIEVTRDHPVELDLVTHDVLKFFGLLLKRNGYVLEQLTSPLVVHTTPEHAEVRALVPGLVTRYHAHHYLGFAEGQRRLLARETPTRVKPLLYTFRVLLTGLHLMRTGEVEANLRVLAGEARLPYLADLIALKTAGAEGEVLPGGVDAFAPDLDRLTADLEGAKDATFLPDSPTEAARLALNDVLVRLRMASL